MRYKPMLAHPMKLDRITEEEWSKGLYIQPKLDGVRCTIQKDDDNVIRAYSRTGKPWLNIEHILEDLEPFFRIQPNTVLDGELYNHILKDDFGKIISLVRKIKPTPEDRLESAEMTQFHCYDCILPDRMVKFVDRDDFIKRHLWKESFTTVVTQPSLIVHDIASVRAKHKVLLSAGFEGSILRKNAIYETKRSWTLMKVKDFNDTEALITGWVEGKGKRIGTIGKFTAVDPDGNEFGMPVMDKFKYLQENFEEMKTWVGRTATFTYFERTKANSYRHPLFKCIRDYE